MSQIVRSLLYLLGNIPTQVDKDHTVQWILAFELDDVAKHEKSSDLSNLGGWKKFIDCKRIE